MKLAQRAGTVVATVCALAVVIIAISLARSTTQLSARPPDDGLAEEQREHELVDQARFKELAAAQAAGTSGIIEPITYLADRSWAGERAWSKTADDWEPAIGADPTSDRVYRLTTRYGGATACNRCPSVAIRMQISKDNGRSWGKTGFLCRCAGSSGQFDPLIEVDRTGSVHAAWLDGFRPGVTYARSDDGGRTWTEPVSVGSNWSDKPVLAVSPNGQHVYVAFNGPTAGDSWMFQSHDGGETFATDKVIDSERYFFAGAGWAHNDGFVAFAQTSYNQNYSGTIDVYAVVSTDAGDHWDPVLVDTVRKQPDCTSKGCYDGYYGSVPGIAMDNDGTLVLAFTGAVVREGRQRMFVRSSTDQGQTWTDRLRLSPKRANAAFPAAAAIGSGDVRLWWMDTRTGRWNVWFRRSLDGGLTWGPPKRLSDAVSGAVYKNRRGFQEAYGDYGEITIASDGATLAIWGEASSYYGPGGSWFNRSP